MSPSMSTGGMRIGSVEEARMMGPSVSRVLISSLENQRTCPRDALKVATRVVAGFARKVSMLKGRAPSG